MYSYFTDRSFASFVACLILLLSIPFLKKIKSSLSLQRLSSEKGSLPVPEYPHSIPFLGLDLIIRIVSAFRERTVLDSFERLSNEVGHTFGFWLLGNRWFITSEPDNVKAILGFSVEDFERGSRRQWGFEPLTGNALHTADGPQWTAARALFRPFFARSKIVNLGMIEGHFDDFSEALPTRAGVVVDLQELFPRLTMDITTEMLFGSSMQTLKQSDDSDVMAFARACEYAQKVTWRRIALGWAAAVLPDQEFKKSLRVINAVIDKYVQRALQQNKELKEKGEEDDASREIFSEHLAQHTQDPKLLRDLLLGALLGGRDTASFLLSNLFHVLARKPKIWQLLRAEALEIGIVGMTQDDLRRMTYARCCVQECE